MPVNRNGLQSQVVPLFVADNGITSWWNLRLFAVLADVTPGPGGCNAELKVNGATIPTESGGVTVQLAPDSYPRRSTSADVLLNNGDIVSIDVQGPSAINIVLSAHALPEGK